MIKATSRQTSDPAGNLDRMVRDSLSLGERAFRDLVRPSVTIGRTFWDEYLAVLRQVASAPDTRSCSPCQVPEKDCPPRCVCALSWEAQPRDTVHGTIRVTNTGNQRRTFAFAATTLTSGGHDTGVTPTIEPASAGLAPQQSVVVHVAIPLSQGFEAGRSYEAEVLIRGVYEQCVTLEVRVEPEPRPHCDVKQGEMPMRVRAHRWYDHFQCEEPCFEPVGRTPRDPDHPPRPVG